jgi:hypothetical protein
MIPASLNIVSAVIGLVVLTLLAASLVSAYQRHVQLKRHHIQRLLLGAQRAERLLAQLAAIALPRDIRLLLRQDILDRYRAVARLHKGYPAIEPMIQQALQRLNGEGSDVGQVLPVPADEEAFGLWQSGIAELLEVLTRGGLLRPQAPDARQTYRERLLERQAECCFGHYMHLADELKQQGRATIARSRIQHLSELLLSLDLHSKRVESLRAQAEEAYQYLMRGPEGDAVQETATG